MNRGTIQDIARQALEECDWDIDSAEDHLRQTLGEGELFCTCFDAAGELFDVHEAQLDAQLAAESTR